SYSSRKRSRSCSFTLLRKKKTPNDPAETVNEASQMDSQKNRKSNDAKTDGSIICRCSPSQIYNLVARTSDDKIARLTNLEFGGTTKVNITQFPTELRRWAMDI
ncbi:hypothetical protein LINPERHAP1_LOCUS35042, partial [Linum perenne]